MLQPDGSVKIMDFGIARIADPDATRQTKTGLLVGTVYYISLNQKNPNLAKPEVRQAFKYLVDYDALSTTILKGIGEIHQSFLPKGDLGRIGLASHPKNAKSSRARRQ